jgi:hypothetical protein
MTDSALGWREHALNGACSTALPARSSEFTRKKGTMDLRILPTYVMLAITEDWLSNSLIAGEILNHRLGVGLWAEVGDAHHALAGYQQRRLAVEAAIASLTKVIEVLDGTHDRNARCLYYFLGALIERTDDPEEADRYRALKATLFPDDLRVTTFSYAGEAGAIVDMERRVSTDMLSTMETIRVGSQSLADVYRDWVAAGKALGRNVQERATLQASLKLDGTSMPEAHSTTMRFQWIRAVRMLLDARDIIGLSPKAHERLMAPLQNGVATVLRRGRGTPPVEPAPVEPAPVEPLPVEPAPAELMVAPMDTIVDTIMDTIEPAIVSAVLTVPDAQTPDAL